ncbi:regucalcin-like [Lycorma delicatula]|uniref:regucalcin-like n=1 Tax=Lycorma delicatula TaxID=130591 RepID=UPI003F5102B7
MSSPINVEPITHKINLGKGPVWDSASERLYFVDMFQGNVHSYTPTNQNVHSALVGSGTSQPLAIIVPVEGEKETFIISMKNDLARIKWDGELNKTSEPKVFQSLEPRDNTNRINNGKVDPKGRLWAGTTGRKLPPAEGAPEDELTFEQGVAGLYLLKDCRAFNKVLNGVSVSNGLEWSSDNKKFFYADSAKRVLEVFDYCHDAGKICNPKPIFDLKENNIKGVLDGMTLSCCGHLYIANYLGGSVLVIDPNTAQLINTIPIPAKEVTSVCWGGPQNDILFVTTGCSEPDPSLPNAGCVFQVTGLGVKGFPNRNAVI